EIMALIRVVDRFAEVEVAKSLFRLVARGERACRGRAREAEHAQDKRNTGAHPVHRLRARSWPLGRYQSPSWMVSGPARVTPSSFGSTPLSKAKVSVRVKSLSACVLPFTEIAISCEPVGMLPV